MKRLLILFMTLGTILPILGNAPVETTLIASSQNSDWQYIGEVYVIDAYYTYYYDRQAWCHSTALHDTENYDGNKFELYGKRSMFVVDLAINITYGSYKGLYSVTTGSFTVMEPPSGSYRCNCKAQYASSRALFFNLSY